MLWNVVVRSIPGSQKLFNTGIGSKENTFWFYCTVAKLDLLDDLLHLKEVGDNLDVREYARYCGLGGQESDDRLQIKQGFEWGGSTRLQVVVTRLNRNGVTAGLIDPKHLSPQIFGSELWDLDLRFAQNSSWISRLILLRILPWKQNRPTGLAHWVVKWIDRSSLVSFLSCHPSQWANGCRW